MILVLSPHLDDAVFSCGGYLAMLDVPATVVTCFTRSDARPTGFALACQRDKGLPDSVDYMALRRAEDLEAVRILGVAARHLDLPEAPHRGYHSATDLFGGIHDDDRTVTGELIRSIGRLVAKLRPQRILFPFGAGAHVDHLQVIEAVNYLKVSDRQLNVLQYFDQPYANKYPGRYGLGEAKMMDFTRVHGTCGPAPFRIRLPDEIVDTKMRACAAYLTQVPFQFGSEEGMRQLLGDEEYFCGQ